MIVSGATDIAFSPVTSTPLPALAEALDAVIPMTREVRRDTVGILGGRGRVAGQVMLQL